MINLRSDFQTIQPKGYTPEIKSLQNCSSSLFMDKALNFFTRFRFLFILFSFICLFTPINIFISKAQTTKNTAKLNLHKTSDLLIHLRKLSPSNLFLKGQKPIHGLSYHYSNWNGKGGIQIFSSGENVKMLSIVAITNSQNLPSLQTPIYIEQLITDLLGNPDGKWFNGSLSKITNSKTELISKDRQVEIAYKQQVQKLTVTIRLL